MSLSKLERETIVLFNEEEPTANIYTHNRRLINKLRRMAKAFPDAVYQDRPEHPGAVSYVVPKSCVIIRNPYDNRRRKAVSEWARAEGIQPPHRSSN